MVWREGAGGIEVLAFRHPLAGCQFVKGGIEPGESAAAAARREMLEEGGVALADEGWFLGEVEVGEPPVRWSVHLWSDPGLPDGWEHDCADDGGHSFAFFWHPIAQELDREWHESFRPAFRLARAILPASGP